MYENTSNIPEYVAVAYRGQRDVAYPQLRDQLDMLWHDIDSGVFGEPAKTSSFYLALKAVKDRYPKPEGA